MSKRMKIFLQTEEGLISEKNKVHQMICYLSFMRKMQKTTSIEITTSVLHLRSNKLAGPLQARESVRFGRL
jgi:hypothetical protein